MSRSITTAPSAAAGDLWRLCACLGSFGRSWLCAERDSRRGAGMVDRIARANMCLRRCNHSRYLMSTVRACALKRSSSNGQNGFLREPVSDEMSSAHKTRSVNTWLFLSQGDAAFSAFFWFRIASLHDHLKRTLSISCLFGFTFPSKTVWNQRSRALSKGTLTNKRCGPSNSASRGNDIWIILSSSSLMG